MTISLLKPLAPFIDGETRRSAQHAVRTGRSWWAVRYSMIDDWVHEWEREPDSPNGHRDWSMLPKRGRQAVRLYCPNGKFAQLGDTHDATGRLIQFKIGLRNFALGPVLPDLFEPQQTIAHVVGMLDGLNGECMLYAWEKLNPPEIPEDAPKPPNEQEWIAKSAEPGLFERAVADWEKQIAEYEHTTQYRAWARRYEQWQKNAAGRLVGPIHDNVYAMNYHRIGRLNADYLGIDDGEGR